MNFRRLVRATKHHLLGRTAIDTGLRVPPALDVTRAVGNFTADASLPFLVSFPRTGSHWLRMMIELYFERPQLKLTFYHTDQDDYLIYHTHDLALDVSRQNVIYLYREPVATIYSQLRYQKLDINDREWIRYWTELYALHLTKWLCDETFTQRKTIVKYERLQSNPHAEFAKVVAFFGERFDAAMFECCRARISKEEIKRRTTHDPQVINPNSDYASIREQFKNCHGDFVWSVLLRDRSHLLEFFSEYDR
jgi:hypothetical protein